MPHSVEHVRWCLRKILKLETTFVNRANTNAKVIQEANRHIREEGGTKELVLFSDAYITAKINMFRNAC